MPSNKKKLQVFVSSTYEDLKVERQAAVNAILSAGHIPAGMELFTAGDESQMNVIKRWIEESDVFLLILGGRYGSIEPKTGKSYIQLEYEYALSLNKPYFAIVIKDEALDKKVKDKGMRVLELNRRDKLEEFKNLIKGKMVEFFEDTKDIEIAIKNTLSEFEKRKEIVGWIRGDGNEDNDESIDSDNKKKLLNNKMIFSFALLIFFTLFFSILYNSYYKEVTVLIKGKVAEFGSNNPIENVQIRILESGEKTHSDGKGSFSFKLYNFKERDLNKDCAITLKTFHESFISKPEKIELNEQSIEVTLLLNPTSK